MPLPDNVPIPSPPTKAPMPAESALKETYLQLLPHPVLVSLVLALDRNHDAVIWPTDLPSAIDSLREYAKRLYAPSKTPIAPIAPAALPPSVGPHNNGSVANNRPTASHTHPTGIPAVPPPTRHLPTQITPRIPSATPAPSTTSIPNYTTQYAPGTYTGQPGQPPARIAPPRNQTGRPPNGPGSGGMPSYEEMIVAALDEIQEPEGLAPKTVFDYMSTHWSLMNNFRPSASQALQKAYKRGRLEKVGGKYRLNPNWEGGNTSKRATRRPQMGDGEHTSPTPASTSTAMYPFPWSKPTTIPGSTPSYGAPRYPLGSSLAGKYPQGVSSLTGSRLAPGSAYSLNGASNLLKIKQESGEEDELEDDGYGDGTKAGADSSDPPSMGLRQTLQKLAQLLQESVAHSNGDGEPAGAG